jgi:hypothetical protein
MSGKRRTLPHLLECRLGILQLSEPGLKNLFKRNVPYSYEDDQRWQNIIYAHAVLLRHEVKTHLRGVGQQDLLLTTHKESVHFALGGAATGWRYASDILQDPTDIIITEDRLESLSGQWPHLSGRFMHPGEVDSAAAGLYSALTTIERHL